MSNQTWVETIVTQSAAGVAFTSTTGSTSILVPTARYLFPSNYFTVGKALRVTILGGVSNSTLSIATCSFAIQMGPGSSVAAFTTGNLNLSSQSSGSSLPFRFTAWLTTRGFSTSATFMGMAEISAANIVTAAGAAPSQTQAIIQCPITSPSAGTAFDATQSSLFDFWATTSISTTGITYSVQQVILEALN